VVNIKEILNNPWLVVVACFMGAWWLMDPVNKAKLPDEIEPVMLQELVPMKKSLNNGDYQMAITGISWGQKHLANPDTKHSPEYLHEQLCGNKTIQFEGYYPMYSRVTGTAHVTEKGRCD
jgi:hypothetical protein